MAAERAGRSVAPWRRLWVKLLVAATLGVVITHSVHVVIANRISARALEEQIARRGAALALLVARQSPDAILAHRLMALQDEVDTVAADDDVAYCFILRGDRVLASSFRKRGTPVELLALRRGHGPAPVEVRTGGERILDLAQPVQQVRDATIRVGMRLRALQPVRRRLATTLGLFAVGVILVGVAASFAVGRRIARPLDEMVNALQTTDPAQVPVPLHERGRDEIGVLAREVDGMRARLHAAHVERELARRRKIQTEKLAALGQLVAGVAHEINNPLAGMKNCQRRLRRDDLPPEKRAEYLELIDEGLARVEGVVGRLLDFARVRSPRRERERLAELAAAAAALVRPGLERRGVEIAVEAGALDGAEANVDGGQITQAIVNLLLNAAYVTPGGGRVTIRLVSREGAVGVEVRDRGPGVPVELRSKIEDPFFTTKPEGEGTGLGLSVTRSIVTAHGGDLSFEFAGEGTAATVWLPVSP
jgi:signal transduction histidine kinase